jgi:hypothetical protein
MAAEAFFAVVEMESTQVFKAYGVGEFLPCAVVAFGRGQVVAGGVGVACVDADADARFVGDAVDDVGQVFKSESEVGARLLRLGSCRAPC